MKPPASSDPTPRQRPAPQPRPWTGWLWLVLLVPVLYLAVSRSSWPQAPEVVPYSEFRALVQQHKVATADIGAAEIRFEMEAGGTKFRTVPVADDQLVPLLEQAKVRYTGLRPDDGSGVTLLFWLLPLALLLVSWSVVARLTGRGRGGPGLMSIGRSKAKVYVETDTKVSFQDVAGVDEAKQELQEVVSFLRDPASYGRLGARMPKGVLLVGPPGTGKTLLARAIAGEAGVPFFSISGSEFVEMFVGVGAARVRDLFEQAREKAPCIIFVDELDALGRARMAGGFSGGGQDEKEQTLNQLLVEMDGFDPTSGLVLLAATNRPEILDPALLRAGRFDRHVLVDRPDRRGREQILAVHVRRIKLAPGVALEQIAGLTPGFTGADLANLANEAAIAATRRGATAVATADFTAAIERLVAGLERKHRLLNERERSIVAYHEMGHALVAERLPGVDRVHKVSIIPHGIGALGYTMQRPSEDRYLMTRQELQHKMAVLMGGRAAEELVFGQHSTGAADDLAKATGIARSMAARYAMVAELGPVAYDTEPATMLGPAGRMQPREYGEAAATAIDQAVQALLQGSCDRARSILAADRELLERGARMLLERESLDGEALAQLFGREDGVAGTGAEATAAAPPGSVASQHTPAGLA